MTCFYHSLAVYCAAGFFLFTPQGYAPQASFAHSPRSVLCRRLVFSFCPQGFAPQASFSHIHHRVLRRRLFSILHPAWCIHPGRRAVVNRRFWVGDWVVGVRLGPKSRARRSGRPAFCPFLGGLVGRSSVVRKTPVTERHELHARVSPRRRAVVKWRFGAGDGVVGVRLRPKIRHPPHRF